MENNELGQSARDHILSRRLRQETAIKEYKVASWLSDIGYQVNKLVQEPKNKIIFQKMLQEWYYNYKPENTDDLENELLPLKERPYSPSEKYSILAAIHNECCKTSDPIHPWTDIPELSNIGTKYFGLMFEVVRGLTEDDEPKIRDFLDFVKRDLAEEQESITPSGGEATTEQMAKTHKPKDKTLWSKIMSKTMISTHLGLDSVHKLNMLCSKKVYEIRQIGNNRQAWQIRIDKLDSPFLEKFKP